MQVVETYQMNSASILEVPAAAVKNIIGSGYSIRASNGEAIVNVRAKKLQYPKEEAANITGKSPSCAR